MKSFNFFLLFILGLTILTTSCKKDTSDDFSIIGKWTQSVEDASYSESEHFTFEFKDDGTVIVTAEGNWGAYLEDGPSIYTVLYTYSNDILRLWEKGHEDDDWKGSVLVKDNNTFEWSEMILHKM